MTQIWFERSPVRAPLIDRSQPVGVAVVNSHSDSFATFILHGSLHELVRA